MKNTNRTVTILALVASTLSLGALLPLAFGMTSMARTFFPLGNALFLSVTLSGPLLLLAAGLHGVAASISKRRFLAAFMVLLVIVGLALFWRFPGHGLLPDWIAMSLAVVLIAAALSQSWLWAVVGGAWTGLLLGLASVQTAVEFLSPAYRGSPEWRWPLWFLGCILAVTTGIVAFVRRNHVY